MNTNDANNANNANIPNGRRRSANPLYVVRNNGKDVEEADGIIELILKKTGLDKIIPIFESVLQMILSEVESYPIFIEVKKMFDKLFEKLIEIIFQAQQMMMKKKIF